MNREAMRTIRANFCNLTGSDGRPIYSACLAAQSPEMQAEWIAQERIAGGTHYVICTFAGYHDLYGERIHYWKEGRWPEWMAALDRILAANLVPVVMLDPGDACPGWPHFAKMLHAIPYEYYEHCIWVPAFEPVKGAWTSRQFADVASTIRATLGPAPLIGYHLSPGRAQFSSNPPEPDDPWGGHDDARCWFEGAGVHADLFLYQSPVPRPGEYDMTEEGWGTRAREVAERFLGNSTRGAPDWFARRRERGRPTLIWFEATACAFIKGESDSAWAIAVAQYAKELGFQGFGNGLPDAVRLPVSEPGPVEPKAPRRRDPDTREARHHEWKRMRREEREPR